MLAQTRISGNELAMQPPGSKERRLTLADGRDLCFAEFGAPHGRAVLYCHGFPGSRLEPAFAHPIAASVGARLVCADRPGMGCSDPHPGRDLLAWTHDAEALVDHLGLGSFSVLGVSGGAPYALACAYRLADRVRATAVVSGVAPPEALAVTSRRSASGLGLRLAKALPWGTAPVCRLLGVAARRASPLLITLVSAKACPRDRQVLAIADFRDALAASLREAFRNGARGAATEIGLLCAPWGFDLGDVGTPVALWHGDDDRVVPMAMGRHLEHALPDCRASYLPGHGHYSLVHDLAEPILSYLVG